MPVSSYDKTGIMSLFDGWPQPHTTIPSPIVNLFVSAREWIYRLKQTNVLKRIKSAANVL